MKLLRRFLAAVFLLSASVCRADGYSPEQVLPKAGQVPGWSPAEEVKIYHPDNLFEYIDGAAETYLDFGFVELAVGEYRSDKVKNASVVVDVYDMGCINNAFGIYANGLYPDADFVSVGRQGYRDDGTVDFWKGRYYTKVTAQGDVENMDDVVLALAKAVAENVKTEDKPPDGVGLFPKDGMVPNTLKYLRQNGLGQSFIGDAFMADYKRGECEMQLLIARYKTEAQAADAVGKFKTFIAKVGKVKSEAGGGFVGEDPYYKTVIVRNAGRYFLCALHAQDMDAAEALLKEAAKGLPK